MVDDTMTCRRHYLQEGVRDAGFAGPMDNEKVARDQIRMVP
jgi:hypothetical protein